MSLVYPTMLSIAKLAIAKDVYLLKTINLSTDPFFEKRGINQGDSLLFFICFRITCILISWSAYAIMPVGKKDMTMFHVNKERAPGCTANTFEGSSLFISVVERPLGYLLSLSCLSNHLQMRWQVTPAATVTKKDMTISICSPPPVAGYRLDNTVSISYLLLFWKYKQFLEVYKIILGLFEYIILKSSALFQTSILSLNLADSFLVLYTQINPVF